MKPVADLKWSVVFTTKDGRYNYKATVINGNGITTREGGGFKRQYIAMRNWDIYRKANGIKKYEIVENGEPEVKAVGKWKVFINFIMGVL